MSSKLTVAALAALALAACATAKPPPAPVAYAGTPQEQWVQGQKAYEAWSAARPGWATTPSGLQYHRDKAAPASAPEPEDGEPIIAAAPAEPLPTTPDGEAVAWDAPSSREAGESGDISALDR